jgi:hypothetical protein
MGRGEEAGGGRRTSPASEVPRADELGLRVEWVADAAVGEMAREGPKVPADLFELAGHLGQQHLVLLHSSSSSRVHSPRPRYKVCLAHT